MRPVPGTPSESGLQTAPSTPPSWPSSAGRRAQGAWVRVVGAEDLPSLAVLISRADEIERDDPAYRAELAQWTQRPAGSPDGLPAEATPDLTGRGSTVRLRDFVLADATGASQSTGTVAVADPPPAEHPLTIVLGTDADGVVDWLRAGGALMALWLRATVDGVQASLLGQVVDLDLEPRPVGRRPWRRRPSAAGAEARVRARRPGHAAASRLRGPRLARHRRRPQRAAHGGSRSRSGQCPGPVITRRRSDSCAPPFFSRVAQASAMSLASVSTCSRLRVSLTRARMIVTSCAFGGSVYAGTIQPRSAESCQEMSNSSKGSSFASRKATSGSCSSSRPMISNRPMSSQLLGKHGRVGCMFPMM